MSGQFVTLERRIGTLAFSSLVMAVKTASTLRAFSMQCSLDQNHWHWLVQFDKPFSLPPLRRFFPAPARERIEREIAEHPPIFVRARCSGSTKQSRAGNCVRLGAAKTQNRRAWNRCSYSPWLISELWLQDRRADSRVGRTRRDQTDAGMSSVPLQLPSCIAARLRHFGYG